MSATLTRINISESDADLLIATGLSVGTIYRSTDDNLWIVKADGTAKQLSGAVQYKSYSFTSGGTGSGEHFIGGYYDYSTTDANLTNASTTVTHGATNVPYAAHAFCVAALAGVTDGSDLVLTVTGTSITDAGVRNGSGTEVIVADCTAAAVNVYFETTLKWIGTVTYTLTSTAGGTFNFDFNYGFCKYDDLGNRDFTITDFEVVGYADADDASFDIQLLHHKATGWTYSAGAFVAGSAELVGMNTDHVTETDIDANVHLAFKRAALSQAIDGSASEGYLIRVTTGGINKIAYLNAHVGSVIT